MRKRVNSVDHVRTAVVSRRSFLQSSTSALLGISASSLAAESGSKDAAQSPPNIVLILADDLGYGDVGCYGNSVVQTPNIDRLAREGARWTQFYANNPVCSPTRASLLSGCYPQRVGVFGCHYPEQERNFSFLLPEAVLLPQPLKAKGYTSALIGKWHLGSESPNLPNDRGFDYFYGFLPGWMDYVTHEYTSPTTNEKVNWMRRNREKFDEPGHATDLFTREACSFIERNREQPFFLYVPYNAPHFPIQPVPEFLAKYKDRPGISELQANYLALVDHLDAGVGKILETLKNSGIEERTLVVFVSDNGGSLKHGANNDPWRGRKAILYEGGIRVPCIVRRPGKIPEGITLDQAAMTMDLFSTLLEAAGMRPTGEVDGVSLLPLLTGKAKSLPERTLFWRSEDIKELDGFREAVRHGNWKLVKHDGAAPELYDLSNDPAEEHDLAGQMPDKAKALDTELQEWFAKLPNSSAYLSTTQAATGRETASPG